MGAEKGTVGPIVHAVNQHLMQSPAAQGLLVTSPALQSAHWFKIDPDMETALTTKRRKKVRSLLVANDRNSRSEPSVVRWSDITRSMADGDSRALATFYEFAFDIMYHEAVRISGRCEQTCLDIVQEAMLKAIRSMKTLESPAAVSAWSRAVAKSAAYDWLRKETRNRKLETGVPLRNSDDDQDRLLDAARLLWIEEQLRGLPDGLQSLISLRYRMGWSLKKIGQSVGLKSGAVDGRIQRAIETLRKKVEDEFDE